MEVISENSVSVVINAPIEKIDLATWLFTLKSHEYQACSAAHIAAGTSVSADNKRMSINVERVADNLLIQHYVEEIGGRDLCRVVSVSDSFSPAGNTKLGITWELKVVKLTEASCEFSNRVLVSMTDAFSTMLKAAGITDLAPVKATMGNNVLAHNQEETPLFAKDIERKALAGIWI